MIFSSHTQCRMKYFTSQYKIIVVHIDQNTPQPNRSHKFPLKLIYFPEFSFSTTSRKKRQQERKNNFAMCIKKINHIGRPFCISLSLSLTFVHKKVFYVFLLNVYKSSPLIYLLFLLQLKMCFSLFYFWFFTSSPVHYHQH